jgi:ABC-type multidrug transport system permease subunit
MSSAFAQLTLARIREFVREPEALFWVYGFPLLMATALGIAFRNQPIEQIRVDVIAAPEAAATTGTGPLGTLSRESRFIVTPGPERTARQRLRGGKTDVVVIAADDSFAYLYDFTRKESVLARNAVEDALQRAAGRRDAFAAEDRNFDDPGGRYIDFLVPGLLGMSLMGGGLWGVGYVIVDMRIRKLLKRFLATPMPRSHFLAAVLASRLLFLLPEVLVLLAFSRFAFGVRSQGGLLGVLVFILLGAIAFAGIGLLVASRARTLESVSGLMNLVMLPMWVLSGIFFSSDRFPAAVQPLIKLLPLTMAIDGLRGVMIDGLAVWSQPRELLGLTLWAVVSFALALRLFRWN